MVAQRQPDLVIMDIIMPEREGIETLLALKKSNPALKVVVMSGGGRIGRLDHLKVAASLGADATLVKPFTAAKLKSILTELLSFASYPVGPPMSRQAQALDGLITAAKTSYAPRRADRRRFAIPE